jgi:carboxymethylenebutenolidase
MLDVPGRAASSHTAQFRIGGDGATVELWEPTGQPAKAGVVLGAEAMGVNGFIRSVAARLAGLGYVVMVPDYLRGDWPDDPDDYEQLTKVRSAISRLDFRRGAGDILDAVDAMRARPDVASARVAVWGYCTGGTLTMLAACLDRLLAAAVLFYPSQLMFQKLSERRPLHPVQLLWAMRCPAVFFYGAADRTVPPAHRARLAELADQTDGRTRLVVYPDADHVFAGPMPGRYRADLEAQSWSMATDLLARSLRPE